MVRIGDILLEENIITEEQLNKGLQIQKELKDKKRLGEVFLDLGYITEDELLFSLSKSLNLEVVSLKDKFISLDILKKIPKSMALNHMLVPIEEKQGKLVIAMSDPLDYYALEEIKSIINMPVMTVIAHKSDILESIELGYKELDAQDVIKKTKDLMGMESKSVQEIYVSEMDTPVVSVINSLLLKAESVGASDIHIEPFEKHVQIRLRVDGQLIDYATLPSVVESVILNRIKVLSNLNIAEKRIPQDGHFTVKLESIIFNVRVSILPTVFGEKIVLRFLNQHTDVDYKEHFGMNDYNYSQVSQMLKNPYGLIYFTGPTGSGKTTTLYMLLESLRHKKVNISTIEDPVEQYMDKVNQTQINIAAGLTFSSGLRSLLRQDPDIIMVGETRDTETAKISVSAAITGHLVLSTLHTNDALSAIVRLEDMGIESYMVANSLIGVVAQRLTKKICPYCKEKYTLPEHERAVVGLDVGYKGKGCPYCNNTGYKGRLAVHESIFIDSVLRDLITKKEDMSVILEYVKSKGFVSLKQNLKAEIIKGNTTVSELLRLSSIDELG